MASPLQENDEFGEDKRISYLDVVRENVKRQGQATMLYRIIICGELSKDGDKTEIGSNIKFLH
jgi:hypothetical protein